MKTKMLSKYLILVIFIISPVLIYAQKTTGIISGKVVDAENGDALPGVNVVVEGKMRGGATDIDGLYRISGMEPGSYTIVATYIGYTKKSIEGVEVQVGETQVLNFSMGMEVIEGQEVVVTAKAVRNTEAALLKDRQNSLAVSDAISAQAISQSGAGNAAAAMKQMTGASVVGGKEVFIRGLGDRYTSTMLNGAELPSTDPYKRAGAVDMIPSNLIDNIVALKSFTPDKPGNFSGGTVDIRTKDFPENLTLKVSSSTSYNPNVNLKSDGYLNYLGGNQDWMGMDDGIRSMPAIVKNLTADELIELSNNARRTHEDALKFDNVIKSFNSTMRPVSDHAPLNQSYGFSVGNQVGFLGRELGFLASLTYSRKHSAYTDGTKDSWYLGAANIDDVDELQYAYKFKEDNSKDEVLWGGLLKGSIKLSQQHVISTNFVYNRNAENTSALLRGLSPYDDEGAIVESSAIQFSEREMYSGQISGRHNFLTLNNTQLEWAATVGQSSQDEPDIRFFTNGLFLADSSYYIKHNTKPRRFYRTLEGGRQEFTSDVSVPFQNWSGHSSKFKFGGLYAQKTKDFKERNFYYRPTRSSLSYNGNVDDFMASIGFDEDDYENESSRYYNMDVVIEELVPFIPWYEGSQDVAAGYAMVELPLFTKLRFIGGLRYEQTKMNIETPDSTIDNGFDVNDALPSLNLIYQLGKNSNARLAYGKTIALPSFREIVPFESYEFIGGITYFGNPELERTLIDNYDLRLEYFPRPGEIFAVSGFYKMFHNPIEKRYFAKEQEMTWTNVDEAWTMGLEFEARKRLDVFSSKLENFMVGGNLALVHSQVTIPAFEMKFIHQVDPDASSKRQFEGQSPYILNMNVSYEKPENGMSASLYYNVFGKRLAFSTGQATPDVYEQPFHSLNFTYNWDFIKHLGFKFQVVNILDSSFKRSHEFKDKEFVHTQYNPGRLYSIGFTYSL